MFWLFRYAPGLAGRWWVTLAVGVHPVPSRTRSLSPPAPTVLGAQAPGRLGRRPPLPPPSSSLPFLCAAPHPDSVCSLVLLTRVVIFCLRMAWGILGVGVVETLD